MEKIIKKDGKIYKVETMEYYGSLSIKYEEIGTYEEKPKQKRVKKKKS